MTAIQKTALATSFVLTSTSGCTYIYLYWSAEGSAAIGIGRSVAFVAIMSCVHAIGYLLYQQQFQAVVSSDSVSSIQISRIADPYRGAIYTAVIQQIVFLVFTSLLLDGGQAFREGCISVAVHWVFITMLWVRRPDHPTRGDIAVIKYGFLPLAFVVARMAPLIHNIVGN